MATLRSACQPMYVFLFYFVFFYLYCRLKMDSFIKHSFVQCIVYVCCTNNSHMNHYYYYSFYWVVHTGSLAQVSLVLSDSASPSQMQVISNLYYHHHKCAQQRASNNQQRARRCAVMGPEILLHLTNILMILLIWQVFTFVLWTKS